MNVFLVLSILYHPKNHYQNKPNLAQQGKCDRERLRKVFIFIYYDRYFCMHRERLNPRQFLVSGDVPDSRRE